MSDSNPSTGPVPQLHAGDWVEVRSADEIMATLDENGALDALPFMPEMLQFCGQRFQVFKSAHKTCDTISTFKGRRMKDAVHLGDLRCSGDAHGGCQAGCTLFWKTAWLKPVASNSVEVGFDGGGDGADAMPAIPELLEKAACPQPAQGEDQPARYVCQATEVVRASDPLLWWQPGQYLKDITSGNVGIFQFMRYGMLAIYNAIMRLHWRGRPYPRVQGMAGKKTPHESLNLQPGELVQVRPWEEIMQTLNEFQRNRGLFYDVEMVPFSGKTYRVHKRVERILNEETGVMMEMPNPCIILEGVTCSGCYSQHRMFCPRNVYPYWREIWLRRVEEH